MKYRLNRDLPFVKKGAEVYKTFDSIVVKEGDNAFIIGKLNCYAPTNKMVNDRLNQLIVEGWVIEASPKELWINFYEGQYGIAYPTKEMADCRASPKRLKCQKYIESE